MKLNLKDPTAIMIAALSDEDAGRIAKAIIRRSFGEEQEVELSGVAKLAWDSVEKELHVSAVRAQAGRKGADKTNADKPVQTVVEVAETLPAEPAEQEVKPLKLARDPEKEAEKKAAKKAEQEAQQEKFDRFWTAYPRHTAKQNAQRAFAKVNPDDGKLNDMLTAIETQKRSAQWSRDNGQYIPHPATWLNQHRWEDEMPAQQTANVGSRYSNPFAELAAVGL